MLKAILIGNVGADAQVKEQDGSKFTTFRVAHNETWTDDAGQQHTTTMWIDCTMNDVPKVAQYIKQGQQVYLEGTLKTRVYSSEKDRCMKAGIQIRVQRIELLGGASDAVPNRLYDKDGAQHDVKKYFLTDIKSTTLMSQRGSSFAVDANGWVNPQPITPQNSPNAEKNDAAEPDRSADGAPAF